VHAHAAHAPTSTQPAPCLLLLPPQVQDKQTAALRELNAKLGRDPRVSFSMVPVGDGMALCRRR
jgi:predicted O-methyltransferase YrrM